MGKAVNSTEMLGAGGEILHTPKIPGPATDLPGPVATSPQLPVLLDLELTGKKFHRTWPWAWPNKFKAQKC